MKKIESKSTESLKNIVIDACLDIKAHDVVVLDLRQIKEAVADYFIICHGDSSTQVNAIANNVVDKVKNTSGDIAISKEGFRNGEWALVDYGDVVAHIFYREKRFFYQLEELWNDAKLIEIKEEEFLKKDIKKSKHAGARKKAK
ncbi:MAG: ribosome silencing factor [Bacteroidota bacterium]